VVPTSTLISSTGGAPFESLDSRGSAQSGVASRAPFARLRAGDLALRRSGREIGDADSGAALGERRAGVADSKLVHRRAYRTMSVPRLLAPSRAEAHRGRVPPVDDPHPGRATVQSLEGGTDLRQHTIVAASLKGDQDLEKALPDSKRCECLPDDGAERDTFVIACPGVGDVVRRSLTLRVRSAHPACCRTPSPSGPSSPTLPAPAPPHHPAPAHLRPPQLSSRPTSVSTLPPTASAASR